MKKILIILKKIFKFCIKKLTFHSSSNSESMNEEKSFEQTDSSSEEESSVKQKKITKIVERKLHLKLRKRMQILIKFKVVLIL